MFEVVLVRHGESEYNVLKRCAGWLDCNLTSDGMAQARGAGRLLADHGYRFDVAYSSELTRAKHTRELILDEMGFTGVPLRQSWRLNERHYGGLDDLTREEAEVRFGQETVRRCREDFHFHPPSGSTKTNPNSLARFPEGAAFESESMNDATARCVQYWLNVIVPAVSDRGSVLVVAHGEILRLLMGSLLHMSEREIVNTAIIPNAAPVVFNFNGDLTVVAHGFLGEFRQLSPVLEAT